MKGRGGRPNLSQSEIFIFFVLPDKQIPTGFPAIIQNPGMKVVEKGRNAVLVCEAGGDPSPTITWIKDTMPIDLKANPRLSLMKQGKLRGKASVEKFGRFYRQSQDILHFLLEPVFPMFVFGVNT